ncbi:unnamed protein product [Symbiodinium sp. KB8]|nr:unnamed protein product [Symbiodinium sp. KB8]
MDTVAAIEDVSPIVKAIEDSPTTVNEPTQGDQGGVALAQLRAQMEASQFAQQMYHQSEMQRQDNIIQALVEKINFLRQEDEGSTIRIQELERQRDVAQQAMEHMNQVNQSLQSDYTHALRNMDEQMQITRRQDEQVAEHLQQELYVLRSEAATTVVELEERVNSDEFKMAKEYEKLTHELHEQARTNMGLRSKVSETEFSVASANEYLQIVMNEKSAAVAGERMTVMALQEEQYDLRRRLANSEERQEDAMREVREAHQRLQHVEDNARQNLPTMHEELHELRRMLRQQEEANSRMRSEYEMCDPLNFLLQITEVLSIVRIVTAPMFVMFVMNSFELRRSSSSSTNVQRDEKGHRYEFQISWTDDYDARIRKLEHRFLAQMEEMQREIDQAKEAEQRLRVDRDEWRLMAEDMQEVTEEVPVMVPEDAGVILILAEAVMMTMIMTILKSPTSRFLAVKRTKSLFPLFQLSHTWTIGWRNALQMFSAHVQIPVKKSG